MKGLFPIVFVGIGRKDPFWKLAFQNRKLGAYCVKLVGVFTFLFLIALCSTWLIFCASSESLAMESSSYSCTRDHPTGNRLDNLISLFHFFSFLAIDVRLADRSSISSLNICCWHSCIAKEIGWNQTGLYYLPLWCCVRLDFYISLKEVPCFCLFEPAYLQILLLK